MKSTMTVSKAIVGLDKIVKNLQVAKDNADRNVAIASEAIILAEENKANAEVESKRASKILDNVSKLLGD